MAFKVKLYHSGMRGAPQKSGTPGCVPAIFDACLVNGFGEVTAVSVTIVGGKVRIVLKANEGFSTDTTVMVTGASVPSVNGEHTVTAESTTIITWATTEADQAVTGTIKVKVAPLNWIKPFSGTNLAVYKSPALEASGGCLQVDDAQALYTKFASFESMSDVRNGQVRCPPLLADTANVFKSEAASTDSRPWWIIGDDLGFYWCTLSYNGYDSVGCFWYGDGVPDRSSDKYRFIVTGSKDTTNRHDGSVPLATPLTSSNNYVSRPINGLGAPMGVRFGADGPGGFTTSGIGQPNGSYPAQINNGLLLSRTQYNDDNGRRGILPGGYFVSVNELYKYFLNGTVIDGQKDLAGKRLMHLFVDYSASTSSQSCGSYFFDITGPWSR